MSTYAGHDDYDIDMHATSGQTDGRPILASYRGRVVIAGNASDGDRGGNRVRIDHGNGWQTRYLLGELIRLRCAVRQPAHLRR